ncbi:MAG: YafY family protein [Pseudomonadota bacterium]
MRRAERLFRLIEILRGRRLAVTAQTLSDALEVSPRTIYRDVAALQASGAPIDGEAGVGYRLDPGYHMPPLMFDPDEVQALLAGLRMARAFTDDELARASTRAEEKVRAALDDDGLRRADRSPYHAPLYGASEAPRAFHLIVRKACEDRRKLSIAYEDGAGAATARVIHPYALLRWQAVWTLVAWCELRVAERHFRLDRIKSVEALEEKYPELSAAHRDEMQRTLSEAETQTRRG